MPKRHGTTELIVERIKMNIDPDQQFHPDRERELRLKRINEAGLANTIVEDVLIILGYQHPRRFKDSLQAIEFGWVPKSINALEILKAHGAIHGVVMASDALGDKIKKEPQFARHIDESEFNQILIEGFSTPYTGEWFSEDQVPTNWVSLAKYGREYTKCTDDLSTGSHAKVFAVPSPLEILITVLIKTYGNLSTSRSTSLLAAVRPKKASKIEKFVTSITEQTLRKIFGHKRS